MSNYPPFTAPPGIGTVYRAVLKALAQYGPGRTGITHIARLADTNRMFIYRNWASPRVLIRDATLHELNRVLHVAREMPGPLPPSPRCAAVGIVVRAARLLREHPIIGTMARTDPELAHAAILRPATVWHTTAWHWLTEHVTGPITSTTATAAQDRVTSAVLTTALPYALTPPPNPSDPEERATERATIDARLSTALYRCLAAPPR